jgi:2-polyprenyl-3-methyl-5-hydroxy-6-metoxy-1,4-benzoquinol methylase
MANERKAKIGRVNKNNDTALEAVRTFWNEHVDDWKIARSEPGSKAFFREIEDYRFEKLHYLPRLVSYDAYAGKTVLDVGCGMGNDTARFARGGAHTFGIDLAPRSIELAKRNFEQRGLAGNFQVMNGEQLAFPDDHFDLVYCHTVLHFTPHPERMLAEIERVLKPGKQAIVMTVNRHSWMHVMHKIAKVEVDYLDSPVFNRYTIAEFRRLLGAFESVRIVVERFPVKTKIHRGIKGTLFNQVFVGTFNLLPNAIVRRTGHHLVAFCTKAQRDRRSGNDEVS